MFEWLIEHWWVIVVLGMMTLNMVLKAWGRRKDRRKGLTPPKRPRVWQAFSLAAHYLYFVVLTSVLLIAAHAVADQLGWWAVGSVGAWAVVFGYGLWRADPVDETSP